MKTTALDAYLLLCSSWMLCCFVSTTLLCTSKTQTSDSNSYILESLASFSPILPISGVHKSRHASRIQHFQNFNVE